MVDLSIVGEKAMRGIEISVAAEEGATPYTRFRRRAKLRGERRRAYICLNR
jgi:hypothetical protein